jgi:hypothetical protein
MISGTTAPARGIFFAYGSITPASPSVPGTGPYLIQIQSSLLKAPRENSRSSMDLRCSGGTEYVFIHQF